MGAFQSLFGFAFSQYMSKSLDFPRDEWFEEFILMFVDQPRWL
jgi:hypothetical protein